MGIAEWMRRRDGTIGDHRERPGERKCGLLRGELKAWRWGMTWRRGKALSPHVVAIGWRNGRVGPREEGCMRAWGEGRHSLPVY